MNLPQTTFCKFAKENDFFVIDGIIYEISQDHVIKKKDYVEVSSNPVGLKLLEKIYISGLDRKEVISDTTHMKQARFVLEDILNQDITQIEYYSRPAIEKVMPIGGLLVNKGLCYTLKLNNEGKLKVAGLRYNSIRGPYMVDEIEKKYLKILRQDLSEDQGVLGKIVRKKYFFDKAKNVGFLITGDDFYIFTKVQAYTLFERKNSRHYAFDEVKVGTLLTDEIKWGKLVVIDSYVHPSLPEFNKSFQQICSGDFDYNAIKRKNPDKVATQIVDLLHKGRRLLNTEYVSSEKEWHQLTDAIFNGQAINSSREVKSLNV